jgi:hypothetical protein
MSRDIQYIGMDFAAGEEKRRYHRATPHRRFGSTAQALDSAHGSTRFRPRASER